MSKASLNETQYLALWMFQKVIKELYSNPVCTRFDLEVGEPFTEGFYELNEKGETAPIERVRFEIQAYVSHAWGGHKGFISGVITLPTSGFNDHLRPTYVHVDQFGGGTTFPFERVPGTERLFDIMRHHIHRA